MVQRMGENEKPINGQATADTAGPRIPRPVPKFTNEDLAACRPFADGIVEAGAKNRLTPQVAVAGAALAMAMLARVGDIPPFQAWKLFDLWMRIISDGEKPMSAPRTTLLADRGVVDDLEDRLRHLIVSCMHGFDLNTDDARKAVKGLAEQELERLRRAKAIVGTEVSQ